MVGRGGLLHAAGGGNGAADLVEAGVQPLELRGDGGGEAPGVRLAMAAEHVDRLRDGLDLVLQRADRGCRAHRADLVLQLVEPVGERHQLVVARLVEGGKLLLDAAPAVLHAAHGILAGKAVQHGAQLVELDAQAFGLAGLAAELADAGGKPVQLLAQVVVAAAALGRLADAADLGAQRLHLALQPVGDILLEVLAQRYERPCDVLDIPLGADRRAAIGGLRLLGGGVVVEGRRPALAFQALGDALAAAVDGALALHDLGDRVVAQRNGAGGLVADRLGARRKALLAASARVPSVRHQPLDAGFQPLDGAIERVERRAFAVTLRVSRSVHLRLALAAIGLPGDTFAGAARRLRPSSMGGGEKVSSLFRPAHPPRRH